MLTEEQIYKTLKEILEDTLQPVKDIEKTSTLKRDLGADSLDHLDVIFRIEKSFGIKIPEEQPFPNITDIELLGQNYVKIDAGRTYLTAKGVEHIKERYPHLNTDKILEGAELRNIQDLITVDSIARYIKNTLSESSS